MASTDGESADGDAAGPASPDAVGHIVALQPADLADAVALSVSAHWNQNEDDWRMMLALGEGLGVRVAGHDGRAQLAASTVVLPYASAVGAPFAWVSMVLVLPEHRRRGHATLLLRHALQDLARRGMAAVLDATPQGHAVYAQEGFRDTWGFARYRREAGVLAEPGVRASHPSPSGLVSRPLQAADWPAVARLDRPCFGADRLPVLRALAQRLPAAARVVEHDGRLRGVLLGRDGREACQLGPLLADDPEVARCLLADALRSLAGAVYVDLLDDRRDDMLPWLAGQGFVHQRPFTRMVHGTTRAPGDVTRVVLVAGPELG